MVCQLFSEQMPPVCSAAAPTARKCSFGHIPDGALCMRWAPDRVAGLGGASAGHLRGPVQDSADSSTITGLAASMVPAMGANPTQAEGLPDCDPDPGL